jgi:hypothetical protein
LNVARQAITDTTNEEWITGHSHSRAAAASAMFGRPLAGEGRINFWSQAERVENEVLKPIQQSIERYESKYAGLKKDLAGPQNMIRELKGVETGDLQAKAFADGMRAMDARAVARAKAAGIIFKPIEEGYLPQFWLTRRVRNFGQAEFLADVRREIDAGGLTITDKATGQPMSGERLTQALDDTARKIWLGSGEGGAPGAFNPEMRVFRFAEGETGADAWIKLQTKYGTGQDILSAVRQHVRRQSQDIALAEIFGPHPEGGFARVLELVKEEQATREKAPPAGVLAKLGRLTLTAINPKALAKAYSDMMVNALGSERVLQRMFDVAVGKTSDVADSFWGGVFGAIRQWHISTAMGGATVTSVPTDSWTSMLAANWNGVSGAQVIHRVVNDLAGAGKENRELIGQLGLTAHAALDAAMNTSRFADQFYDHKIMSRIANTVVRASGLEAWTQALKRAFTMEFLGHVARQSERGFDDLEGAFRGFLDRYGFTSAEWDTIRATPHLEVNGARYFDPEAIADKKLGDRLVGAIIDERGYAVLEPDIYTKQIAAAVPRGTFLGEIAGSMLQYKQFPMSMVLTHVQRGANQVAEGGMPTYMANLALGMTLAGAMAVQAKSLLAGKGTIDMSRPDFWALAATTGGGAGIYGDLVNSAFTRADTSLAATLAGPVGSVVDQTARLTSGNVRQAVHGQPTHFWSEASNFLRRGVPGANLWYTRLVTDRLIMDQIQRAIDPEYNHSFRRVEEKARKDYDQRFWWGPGHTSPTFAGPTP